MARVRAVTLKAVLLLVIPAMAFWACVTLASSVMLGFAVVAAWYALLVLLPSLRLQNASLALLSIVLAWTALELVMRTNALASVIFGRDTANLLVGQEIESEPPYYVPDEILGFRLAANRRSRSTLMKDGRLIYDVVYTMDAHGFRALPRGPAGATPVLMLGDSFNFGLGINDDQTLAYYLQDLSAGRLQPFVLATPGMGPHQVLRQLEIGEPTKSGHKTFAWALMSIVDDHVLRASGRSSWLRDTPRYDVDADDRLVLHGNYLASSKFVQNLIVGSRAFALTWIALTNDPPAERRRFVRILREIKTRLSSEYGAKLLMLYYSGQTWRGELTGWRDEMVPLLCQAGVPFIEVNALLRGSSVPVEHFYIAGDGHPTPQLNRLLASAVIAAMTDGVPPSPCRR